MTHAFQLIDATKQNKKIKKQSHQQENKISHTYDLIEAKFSMRATKYNKAKENEKNNQVVSFRRLLCISLSFLFSLVQSRHDVSF